MGEDKLEESRRAAKAELRSRATKKIFQVTPSGINETKARKRQKAKEKRVTGGLLRMLIEEPKERRDVLPPIVYFPTAPVVPNTLGSEIEAEEDQVSDDEVMEPSFHKGEEGTSYSGKFSLFLMCGISSFLDDWWLIWLVWRSKVT
jgi:hypothetical protein